MTVIDGSPDYIRIFEGVGIFLPARRKPGHQLANRSYARRHFDQFFRLADSLTDPRKITQPCTHSSTMYCKPARM